jgi:hypothetical protein
MDKEAGAAVSRAAKVQVAGCAFLSVDERSVDLFSGQDYNRVLIWRQYYVM